MAIKIPEPRYDYDAEDLAFRYKQAVEQIMNKLVTTDPKGYSKAFQMAQLKEIADILSELNDESKKWVEEHIPEAVREGSAVTLYAAGIVGSMEQARKLVKFSALNERMVEAVIADTQGDLLSVTQNVERRVRNQIRAVSADVMRRNMAAGINGTRTNKREILTDLRSRLGSALDTGIVDAAGRRWKPDVYVKMLVQTKMMYAHTEGTTNEALERGIQYATISKHGATDACRQWEGKIVKLVPEAPGSYPTVAEAKASRQIFHPNCKHLIVPIRDPSRVDPNAPKLDPQPEAPQPVQQKEDLAAVPQNTDPALSPVAAYYVARESRLNADKLKFAAKHGGTPEIKAKAAAALEDLNAGKYAGNMIEVETLDYKTDDFRLLHYEHVNGAFIHVDKSLDKKVFRDMIEGEMKKYPKYFDGLKVNLSAKIDSGDTARGSFHSEADKVTLREEKTVGDMRRLLLHEVGHRRHSIGENDMRDQAGITISDKQWTSFKKSVNEWWKPEGISKPNIHEDVRDRFDYPINAKFYYGKKGTKNHFYNEMFAESTSVYLENDPAEIAKMRRGLPGVLEGLEKIYGLGHIK